MSALYPSLEDMKVHQIQQAQVDVASQYAQQQAMYRRFSEEHTSPVETQSFYPSNVGMGTNELPPDSVISSYPSLMDEYMGLRLEPPSGPIVQPAPNAQSQVVPRAPNAVVAMPASQVGSGTMIAPLSGTDVGLKRAAVSHGVREVTICKDANGKCGLRLRAINNGIFVQCVTAGSPAAMAQIRFGDQILQINGENVAGYSDDKAMDIVKKSKPDKIIIALRDRPFERTITLHKDSTGHVGFMYKNGKVIAITKDSSAARNGLLTEHQILEIGGQNVVGMKDADIGKIVSGTEQILTITIMPSNIYEHMIKHMAKGLVSKLMDHSIPEV